MPDTTELSLIKKHITDKPVSGKVYLQLLHGRKSPSEDMDDFGFDGPTIGPLKYCHVTYSSTMNLGFEDDSSTGPMSSQNGFGFHDEFIFYDGCYYGDWEVQVA